MFLVVILLMVKVCFCWLSRNLLALIGMNLEFALWIRALELSMSVLLLALYGSRYTSLVGGTV